jgi:hypothetical protein
MEAMRESWTDERLDDFRAETARRFDEIDKRFDKVDARFDKIEAKFDARFERLDERLEALNRAMLQFGIGSMIVFVVGFASLIVSQL